ncbi:nectin-4 isoform X2 [Lates calcarifer]|uniref:Nectin-4 isoform X2 n=1 Tax=Lates calcarifer TaxID=8187 RepID=A0AAJ7LRX6_LATCA|nr:nectin-4 isoform X2 [Lates calcarifer]
MTSLLSRLCLCLFVLRIFVTVIQGEFVDLPPNGSMRSLAEEETVLPCHYQPSGNDVVVQVTWYKEKSDGTKEQIILAHHINGQTAFGPWSRRVRFRSSEPTVDSSLVIMSTEVSDEGKYICHISTFPSGNFENEMSLIVWTIPISSLEPVILVEGQSYRQAASCRSIARPSPRISWDTDLNGQSINRSSDNGAVSSHYSLHPLRSMNGKKLDCLVWHVTSPTPRRLRNRLVVHFPPHVEVSSNNKDWSVGLENAALSCVSGGNPKPQSFTWIRKDSELPEGVIPHPNGTLIFGRPLSLSDRGIYKCVAKNEVGEANAEMEIVVTDSSERQIFPENMLMLIVGGVAGGLLILMLIIVITVTCHHKRKNTKLEKELTEKKEEISTLSRQASFRRVNSISTDTRGATEENIPLRVEGTLRTSLSSLGQETRFHPPLTPSPFPTIQSTEIVRQLNGSVIIPTDGGSRPGSVTKNHQHPPMSCTYPPVTDDEDEVDEGLGGPASQEHPDDQDSETNSSQVSEAHSTRYQQTNGMFRPKPRPSPSGISPHASLIHKAQIV